MSIGAGTFSSPWRKGKSMTISSTERRIRATLPITRFMQTFIPLPVAHWLLKQGMARRLLDADVIREAVTADGVPCEWIIPQNSPTDRALLYLHGGGFVFGLTPQHLRMGPYLAQKMGMRILMADYRTAPKTPFPAALDDCVTTYLWLLNQG
jgi:acetyl esterase/lipase